MKNDELQRLAIGALADYDGRTPGRLFAGPVNLTTAEAYMLQAEIARLREERGETVIGYKLGCTSKPIQAQLGIQEPIFARLFESGRLESGARLSSADFANLAIEGELAVRLGSDLPGPFPAEQACRDAIESIFPVIELHHYALRSDPPRVQELIVSNGMHAGFIVAGRPHGGPQARVQRMRILINDQPVDGTTSPWTMGDPIASVRWLAARLAEHGLGLLRGQVILTGSPMRLLPVAAGGRVVVEAPPLEGCSVRVGP
jgi:2-keto-4-pentenoate hydratase